MFGLGTTEIILIVAAGAVIFGAKRIPEMGAAIGKGLRNFKKAIEGPQDPELVPPSSKEDVTTDPKNPEKTRTPTT